MDSLERAGFDPRVNEFIERVYRNFGELIPLKKKSPKGEILQLGVRHIIVPSEVCLMKLYPHAFERFKSMILMDVLVPDSSLQEGLRSIARRDWFIEASDYASSSGNLRDAIYMRTPLWSKEADNRWRESSAGVGVAGGENGYQGMGIGTFMTAVSLPVLQKTGVKEVGVRVLVGNAIEGSAIRTLWKKFGVEERKEPYLISELASHPNVNRSILDFI